jgi:WD40 repeat protein
MAVPDIEEGPSWPIQDPDSKIAYDSGYQHYACETKDGLIHVCTIPGGRELQRLKSNPLTRTDLEKCQLTLSPDGRFIARLEESGELKVWRWESGESVLKSAPRKCSALAFSSDNRRLAVGHEALITCFDLTTGKPSRRWQAVDRAYQIEFHPDNGRLAAGYFQSNVVSIYNVEDGTHLADLPTGASTMTIVAWHPDGKLLATAGSDPRIHIWDVPARRKVAVLEGHVQQVNYLMFHWTGEFLGSMAWDNDLRLWQPLPGRLLMKVPSRWMGFSREGRWAGVIRPDLRTAQLWAFVPSQEYHTFLNTFSESESGLLEGDISPDGALLALGALDGLRLWDVMRGLQVGQLQLGQTTSALFRDDGRELLTCGPIEGLRRWSVPTNREPARGLHLGPFHQVALPFAPMRMAKGRDDRTLVVVGEQAGQCAMLDLVTETVRDGEMQHAQASYVTLSPDAQRVATSGWHSDRVKLWDSPGGKLLNELEGGVIARVFFTPVNELIVARDHEFTFHHLDSLAISRSLPRSMGLYPGFVAFTADGKMMALELAPGLIHLQEVTSGRTVAKLEDPHGDLSTWMSFTPDGTQLLVAARYAGAIHRWDLRAIRERLKTMGLDWDWPVFAPPGRAGRLGN